MLNEKNDNIKHQKKNSLPIRLDKSAAFIDQTDILIDFIKEDRQKLTGCQLSPFLSFTPTTIYNILLV